MTASPRLVNNTIQQGKLTLEPTTCVIRYAGEALRLAAIEYRILSFLIRRAGDVVTYGTLAAKGLDWIEYDEERLPKLLSTLAQRIERKLSAAGAPSLIHSIDGVGFHLSDKPV